MAGTAGPPGHESAGQRAAPAIDVCDTADVPSPLPMPPPMGLAASIVVLLTVAYFVLVAPVLGRRRYQRLVALQDTDPPAVGRYYRKNVGRKWLWLAPVLLAAGLWPGLRPEHLGLAWPHGPQLVESVSMVVLGAFGLAFSAVIMVPIVRSGRSVPGLRGIRGLAPRTRAGHAWALAAFVSASVVEEVLYRGLLLAAGLSLGLSAPVVVVLTAAAFGVVHLYQGTVGMLFTGLLGLVFAAIVLETGSLLLAIVLHLLLNLRAHLILAAVPPKASTVDTQAPVPAS
jgi:membrane protease YdiL (CAAX protease family)